MAEMNPSSTRSRLLRPDFDRPLSFTFEGKQFTGYEGDSVASALYRAGVRVFSRSFKYHRPRGLMAVDGTSPNDLVEVDRVPNVHASTTLLRAGMQVRAQNAWPSARFDLLNILDKLGGLLPVGFYYKTMIRPRVLWPFYEKVLRRAAGLGSIHPEEQHPPEGKFEKTYLQADVTVVGGGPSGMAAALAAADQGARVILVEKEALLGGHLRISQQEMFELERTLLPGIDLVGIQTTAELAEYLAGLVRAHSGINVLTSATAFGWYEGNQVGVKQGDRLVKLRTKQLVVAAGRFEQPIVFQKNDLPGVFLAGGVQRLINLYGIKPGEKAVVVTSNGQGWAAARDLLDCGVEIALVADTRSEIPENPDIRRVREGDVPIKTGMRIQQALGSSNVRGAVLELARGVGQTITLDCDLIVVSGGYAANNALLYQSGSKIAYDAAVDDFVPQSTPPGVLGAGHAAGTRGLEVLLLEGAAAGMQAAERVGYVDGRGILPGLKERVARLKDSYRENSLADPGGQIPIEGNKAFICFCEDVVPKDVVNAAAEGFDDIQTLKRYTTISMGPSQGKICAKNTIKLLARLKQQGVAETGTTTSRPPFTPVKLGVLAGRKLDPVRQTPMHHAHLEMNAAMMNTGLWKRPEYYTDPEDEILAVRQKVGIIDVSTLGKMEVRGPDAAAFLERIYTGKLAGLRAGRLRYGLMCTEEGIIFDDGVVGRLDEEYFFLTTTSGGAQSVYEWLTWWAAAWGSRAQIIDHTSSFAAVNLAGPQARNMLTNLTDIDLSNRAFPYMRMRLGELAGIPCRMMRIGFVGELGYEIHFPAEYGRDVWSLFLEAGAEYGIAPFALEAQRVLRLEKGHIILGQDTDALSDPYSAGMGWAVKLDKPDFIGKPSLILKQNRTAGERLVGFEMVDPAVVPAEGEQFVEDGRLVGRVTSARYSPILEKSIGLGWVDSDKSALGSRITLRTGGRVAEAEIAKVPFYDPEGKQLRS